MEDKKRKAGRPPIANPYDKMVHGILTTDMHNQVLEYCDSVNITFSCFLRKCIEEFLKNKKRRA